MQIRTLPPNYLRSDLLLALALAVTSLLFGVFTLASGFLIQPSITGSPDWLPLLGGPLLALPLALRRRHPVLIAAFVPALYIVLAHTVGFETYASQVTLFLAVYTVGAWHANRRATFWVRLIVVVGMGVWLMSSGVLAVLNPELMGLTLDAFIGWFISQVGVNALYFGAAWIFGNRAWASALERQELEEAHRSIRQQQEQLADQAVELERVRIARELHDVVAHHVSAMGVQAGAARRVLRRDADRAEAALRLVEGSARDAISELRSMVTTLRSDGTPNEPLPTLADLDNLIAASADAGEPVSVERIGDIPVISPAAELTLFRIAQEGLTNARKHAGGSPVVVRLRGVSDGIELEVSDAGRPGISTAPGTGHGVIGMHERAQAVGGRLEAGPKSSGGWLVRAWMPASPAGTVGITGDENSGTHADSRGRVVS